MPSQISDKATKGVVWTAIERFSVQGIQFLLSIVIARFVLPEEYGLVAMIGIFLAVSQTFIDSGFSNALIQKQNRTDIDYSTVFFFNIVIGLIIYLLICFASGSIAAFYNEPQLRLLIKVVGLNIVISSFVIVQRAKLTIALNFRKQAIASFVGTVVGGGIGIYMAYSGCGVWSLVLMSLLNNLLTTVMMWSFARWIPSFAFSYSSFRELFNFGSKLLLSGLLHTIYMNLYTLVIGKRFSAIEVGLYNRAYTFAYFPSSNITDIMHKAMFPILCGIQNEEEGLLNGFIRYIRMACFLIFPLMLLLCVLASPLIDFLLTEKWSASIPVLQILCLAYMWDPVMRINNHFLYVRGRTDYTLKAEVIKKIVAFTILVASLNFGLYIMCWGLVVYSLIDIFIITRYTKRVYGIGLRMEIRQLFPIFLLSVASGGLAWLSTWLLNESLAKLFVGFFVGLGSYICFSKICKFPEYTFIIEQIKRFV